MIYNTHSKRVSQIMNKNNGVINIFDFDGVVSTGITPRKCDIIITGRCFDECSVVYNHMRENFEYDVAVFFNPIKYSRRGDHTEEARSISGRHKADTIYNLLLQGVRIGNIFEDDPLQIEFIKIALTKFFSVDLVRTQDSRKYTSADVPKIIQIMSGVEL